MNVYLYHYFQFLLHEVFLKLLPFKSEKKVMEFLNLTSEVSRPNFLIYQINDISWMLESNILISFSTNNYFKTFFKSCGVIIPSRSVSVSSNNFSKVLFSQRGGFSSIL